MDVSRIVGLLIRATIGLNWPEPAHASKSMRHMQSHCERIPSHCKSNALARQIND